MLKQKIILFDFSGTLVKMRPARLLVKTDLLSKIAQKYTLGIVTGAKRTETTNILNKTKVLDYFKVLITKDDNSYGKPDPRIVSTLSNNYKIQVYIGDSKKDEYLAKNLNVTFFRVIKSYNINQILETIYDN